jgi:uncharacterized membrane protein HdeD (DUF308 family)
MILIILGIFDIIMGVFLALSGPMKGIDIILWLGVIVLLKGIYSMLSNFASGFLLDLMGVLDLLCGIFLVMAFYGFYYHFFLYVGILMFLKGLYSVIMGLTSY